MDVTWLGRVLLITCLYVWSSQSYDAIVVSTKYGQIRGVNQNIPLARGPIKQIHRFLGIPYAQAPVKELRFLPPRPHKGWKPKLFNAQQFGSICPQIKSYLKYMSKTIKSVWPSFTGENASEDCLTLNIYTPAFIHSRKDDTNSSLYPVLFYIHGGSFVMGTPARDKTIGDILPSYGVILVTIQYRLGPFGFMTTGDSAAPGNYGLLDQVEALKWVNENIADFGGDPKRITIAGNSAGAASVALHSLSPLTKGLFQGAIMESGVEFSSFALLPLEEAIEKTKHVGRKLLCDTENNTKMMECLRSKDTIDILYYYKKFPAPVVDNYFLLDTPQNLWKKGLFHGVPVIIGFNKHEGLHSISDLGLEFPLNDKTFRRGIERSIQDQFDVPYDPMVAKQMADALEFQYYPWNNRGNSLSLYRGLVKMMTDFFIIAPSFKAANFHDKHSKTYVFHYQYISRKKNTKWISHSINVEYSFGAPFANITHGRFNDEDRNVSHFIMNRYANFVKYGSPNSPSDGGIHWTQYTQRNGAYLDVSSKPKIAYHYHPNRVAFWNYYVPKIKEESCSSPPTMDAKTAGGQNCSQVFSFLLLICIVVQLQDLF